LDLIQGRGDKDPLDALSEIITTNKDPNIVAQASNILAPYLHSKRSTAPVSRYPDHPVEVPEFHSLQEAEAYLAHIPVLLGKGELDSQSALELSTLTKNWLDAIYARQAFDLKLEAQGGGSDLTIRIEGGLPALPGTNVIGMGGEPAPQMNGHAQGPVIENDSFPQVSSHVSEPDA
jgi:hypothetical protein